MDVQINLNNIKPYNIDMVSKGFYIRYKKKIYFITLNHSFSIKSLTIKNKDYRKITNCLWNEIVYCETENFKNHSVFSIFSVKQIDSSKKYYVNNKELKFIENEYFPLHMLHKSNKLYYKMKIIERNIQLMEGDSQTQYMIIKID